MTFRCLPTSRAEAIRLGLTQYDNGTRCPRGHDSIRHVSGSGCIFCKKEDRKGSASYKARCKRSAKEWSIKNPDRRRVHSKKSAKVWRTNNPESYKASSARNRRTHKLLKLALNHKRRANVNNAEGFFTNEDVSCIFDEQKGQCTGCTRSLRIFGYTIDHKTPISRGGSNWPDNIQLLCSHCNSSKGTKTDEEWRATFPT